MMNFGEQDLYDSACSAGFDDVRMTLVVERKPGSWVRDWESMLKTAPNPNAHTAGEIMAGALTPEEASRFGRTWTDRDQGRAVMESAFVTCARR